MSTSEAGITPTKPKMGMTGVQLCYYKKEDFVKLTKPQQQEILAWNKSNPGKQKKKDDKGKPSKKYKAEISAMSARNKEMLEVMIALNEAQLKLWEVTKAPGSDASKQSSGSSGQDVTAEESIRANEHARLAVVRLQAIQKAEKPPSKPPVFPAP